MTYKVYCLDDAYIGITTKDVDERAQEHVIQAIKNNGTLKDRHIYNNLLAGRWPEAKRLFTSAWTPEDIAAKKAEYPITENETPEKHHINTMKRLAGQDEIAVTILCRDVLGMKLFNIAAGTTQENVSRAITLPRQTSANFLAWTQSKEFMQQLKSISKSTLRFTKEGLTLLPVSQVKTQSKNSVTWDDQETPLIITLTREYIGDHVPCGPDTRHLWYKWRNTVKVGNENFEHWERYIDTYKVTGDMKVGGDYIVFSEKRIAPEDPHTKCWWWGNHEVFDDAYVMKALFARLDRLAAVKKHFPAIADWDKLYDLEVHTQKRLNELSSDIDSVRPNRLSAIQLAKALA